MSRSLSVLFVDDDGDLRHVVEKILTAAGHVVATAEDGAAGLVAYEMRRPDVIVCDLMMPEMDGLQFLDLLPSKHPPVIVVSAFEVFAEAAFRRGAAAYIAKPFEAEELLAAISAAYAGEVSAPKPLKVPASTSDLQRASEEARRALLDNVKDWWAQGKTLVDAVARWAAAYFGCDAFVNVHADGDPIFHPSTAGSRFRKEEIALCSHVTRAESTLLLDERALAVLFGNGDAHPLPFRSCAGVPLRTAEGAVLGTLCLLDREARVFHLEDLAILEHLAGATADRIMSIAGRGNAPPVFVTAGVLSRDLLVHVVEAGVRRVQHRACTLGVMSFDVTGPEREAVVKVALETTGPRGVALGELSPCVLAVVIAGTDGAGRANMVAEMLKTSVAGAGGITTLSAPSSVTPDGRSLLSIADEARARASQSGSHGLERHSLDEDESRPPTG